MHSVGVPASDSQSRLLSHHSLDIAEVVPTAASATVHMAAKAARWSVPSSALDHAARAEIHATIATLSQVIERVSRPKPFIVEVAKGIDNDFLNRCRDAPWIPPH